MAKRDVHKLEQSYITQLKAVRKDPDIIPANKELIFTFMRALESGETVIKGSKKKVGTSRRLRYLYDLPKLSKWFNKEFSKLTKEDIREVINNKVDSDEYGRPDGKPYSESMKYEFKKTLKKFFNWYNEGSLSHITNVMDTDLELKEPKNVTFAEVMKVVNTAKSIKHKAMVVCLFDSGCRVEEYLNIKIGDISKDQVKETSYYTFNIRTETVKRTKRKRLRSPVTLYLKESNYFISLWLEQHPEKDNKDAYLFPFTYGNIRKILSRLAIVALGRSLSPHVLRHGSAYNYAHKMNRQELCDRYNWAYSSDMPDVYIQRGRKPENDKVLTRLKKDSVDRIEQENEDLREQMKILQDSMGKMEVNFFKAIAQLNPDMAKQQITPEKLEKLKTILE